MSKYDLESTDFALSENGIHLLRSGFNYKTITYHDLDSVSIKRGIEIKNSLLILLIGIAMVSFSLPKKYISLQRI